MSSSSSSTTAASVETATPVAKSPTTDEETEAFKRLCDGTDSAGWTTSSKRKTCTVFSGKVAGNETIRVRLDCTRSFVGIPAEVVFSVVTEQEHFSKWDEQCIEYRVVEKIDSRTELMYYSIKMPAVLTNRDWVLRRSTVADPARGEFCSFGRSVVVPELPPRKEFIRAEAILTGFFIRRGEDGSANVFFFAHNNFRGKLPTKLVNWATKSLAASIVVKIRNAAASLCKVQVPLLSPVAEAVDPIPTDLDDDVLSPRGTPVAKNPPSSKTPPPASAAPAAKSPPPAKSPPLAKSPPPMKEEPKKAEEPRRMLM